MKTPNKLRCLLCPVNPEFFTVVNSNIGINEIINAVYTFTSPNENPSVTELLWAAGRHRGSRDPRQPHALQRQLRARRVPSAVPLLPDVSQVQAPEQHLRSLPVRQCAGAARPIQGGHRHCALHLPAAETGQY